LLLLLDEIGAADEANGDFVAEFGEELEHLGLDELRRQMLACGSEERYNMGSMVGDSRNPFTTRNCLTFLAFVSVSSTSNRTTVFLIGRSLNGG
jgi:hypothetical protein